MAADASTESPRGPTCYRCDDQLDENQLIRLSVVHEGESTQTYLNVDRPVCVDCVAALGMLEFRTDRSEETMEEEGTPLRDRLPPIRSISR